MIAQIPEFRAELLFIPPARGQGARRVFVKEVVPVVTVIDAREESAVQIVIGFRNGQFERQDAEPDWNRGKGSAFGVQLKRRMIQPRSGIRGRTHGQPVLAVEMFLQRNRTDCLRVMDGILFRGQVFLEAETVAVFADPLIFFTIREAEAEIVFHLLVIHLDQRVVMQQKHRLESTDMAVGGIGAGLHNHLDDPDIRNGGGQSFSVLCPELAQNRKKSGNIPLRTYKKGGRLKFIFRRDDLQRPVDGILRRQRVRQESLGPHGIHDAVIKRSGTPAGKLPVLPKPESLLLNSGDR